MVKAGKGLGSLVGKALSRATAIAEHTRTQTEQSRNMLGLNKNARQAWLPTLHFPNRARALTLHPEKPWNITTKGSFKPKFQISSQ